MNKTWRKVIAAVGVALALGSGTGGVSRADDTPAGVAGPHGGRLQRTAHYQFEAVFTAAGFNVFPYGLDGRPLDASKLNAKATFYHPSSPQPWFSRPLAAGQTPGSLDCAINLGRVPAAGVKVTFEVGGLPDPAEPTATFTAPFALARAAAPPAAPPTITYGPATQADQAAVNAQRVCPVSRKPLGSMGGPIKVTRGDRSVFLCCQGCLGKVTANPDAYLGAAK